MLASIIQDEMKITWIEPFPWPFLWKKLLLLEGICVSFIKKLLYLPNEDDNSPIGVRVPVLSEWFPFHDLGSCAVGDCLCEIVCYLFHHQMFLPAAGHGRKNR